MAFRGYMRFGWLIGAIAATMAVTAPAYADTSNRMFASSDYEYGNVIVLSYTTAFDSMKAFADLALPAAIPGSNVRPTFQPAPIKQRASRSAVRPTAIAGWRSGRTRHLAVA